MVIYEVCRFWENIVGYSVKTRLCLFPLCYVEWSLAVIDTAIGTLVRRTSRLVYNHLMRVIS